MSRRWAIRGSVAATHRILSSLPISSRIRNIPIARQAIRQPGKVGSSRRTSVKRVPVVGERVLDEAIVGRIAGRGEQHPVQPYPSCPMFHLLLVALAPRDLDDQVEVHSSLLRRSQPAGGHLAGPLGSTIAPKSPATPR